MEQRVDLTNRLHNGKCIHEIRSARLAKLWIALFTAALLTPVSMLTALGADLSTSFLDREQNHSRLNGIDPAFVTSVTEGQGRVHKTLVQPDGKIIAVGSFVRANGVPMQGVARYNADGSLDSTFNPGGSGADNQVFAVALLADGKIMIGGDFLKYNGQGANLLARLNADGTFDGTFGNSFFDSASGFSIYDIAVETGGSILVGGRAYLPRDSDPFHRQIFRLTPDGSIDPSFNTVGDGATGAIRRIVSLPDGRILIAGDFTFFDQFPARRLARLSKEGYLEVDFNIGAVLSFESVQKIVVEPDGNILAGGVFISVAGAPAEGLARFGPEGNLITVFDVTNTPGSESEVSGLVVQAHGRVVATINERNLHADSRVIRFQHDGTRDQSFIGGNVEEFPLRDVLQQPDGKLIVAGEFLGYNGNEHKRLARIDPNGNVDAGFVPSASTSGSVFSMAQQPDGKIVIGGDFEYVNGIRKGTVARLNANGTLDNSFNFAPGTVGDVFTVFVEASGKIAIGGNFVGGNGFPASIAARLNPDGSLDHGLIPNDPVVSFINAISAQSDGRLILGGSIRQAHNDTVWGFTAIRVNLDGSLDPGFGEASEYFYTVRSVLVQPDDSIIVGGPLSYASQGGGSRIGIARLKTDGRIDHSYAGTGAGDWGLTRNSADGSIFASRGGSPIRKFNADGSLDPSFAPPTMIGYPITRSIMSQPDGKVIYGGYMFDLYRPSSIGYLTRVDRFGAVDPTFNIGSGPGGPVYSIAKQPSGDILVAGNFSTFNGVSVASMVRVHQSTNTVRTSFDYDGDARSDISVFRASGGAWYLQQSRDGLFGTLFGASEDKITPADFDGDGKTDVAVYRPSTGIWYVTNSATGTVSYHVFGVTEDLPVPADYDGDGKADIAVFRPSTGTWYRQNSSDGSFYGIQFGTSEDKPTVGDFDGDGKSDIGVFRPSTGAWYRINSSNGSLYGVLFGVGSDVTVPADYDGDGKTDIAVYRPSTGIWYITRSSTGAVTYDIFGLSDDIAAPGDFDGDGKSDLSVFRPTDGNWYRQNSSDSSFFAFQFGTSGDKPTQTAFRY